jgi:cardiolipin synthase (CMP-forming)
MMKSRIPMILTYARVTAIPLVVGVWHLGSDNSAWWVFGLFLFASLTDYLDGFLARRWNVTSEFGAMLDQIADKLLVAAVLVMLCTDHHLPATLAIILLLREVLVSGLREYAGLAAIALPVSRTGKWKTALQLLGLTLCLGAIAVKTLPILLAGHALLAVSALLAWISAVQYLRSVYAAFCAGERTKSL